MLQKHNGLLYNLRIYSAQAIFKDSRCFTCVPELPHDDASNILQKWLQRTNRTLQPSQLDTVLTSVKKCPLPLFLKISFEEAVGWKSYSPPSETVLEDTVRQAIDLLFQRVERKHGETLVKHALGYITAGKCSVLKLNDLNLGV